MRRYIYIFGLTVLFWGTSCADFINIQPENATTYSNYYKNEKELEAVLTGLQVYLRQAVGEFTGGDISRAGEILDYDRSSRKGLTLSNVGTWKYYYYTIYQANLILENTHRFKGDPEKLKPYIQQAYFAKAVAYFYLAMNYGQVPITGSTIEFSKFPQSPISSVLDEAEKWGLKAMDLPTYEDLVATSKESRMKQYGSKGAAAALLAHLYAWRAGVEGKKECWAKAEEYCTMLIEGKVGSYSLAADPETVCTSVMKGGSAESIWEIYYDSQEGLRTDLPITFPIALGSAHPINNQYSDGYYKSTVRMMYAPEDLRRDAYFWNIDADSLFLIYKSNAEVYAATEHKPNFIDRCIEISVDSNDVVVDGRSRIGDAGEVEETVVSEVYNRCFVSSGAVFDSQCIHFIFQSVGHFYFQITGESLFAVGRNIIELHGTFINLDSVPYTGVETGRSSVQGVRAVVDCEFMFFAEQSEFSFGDTVAITSDSCTQERFRAVDYMVNAVVSENHISILTVFVRYHNRKNGAPVIRYGHFHSLFVFKDK